MTSHAHTREQHPLVFVFTHWINLICIFLLILSGFYIHFPFVDGFMGVARGLHFFAMFTIIINLVFRVIAAFVVASANQPGGRDKDKDIKNWLPQPENRHQLWPTVKYYLFIRKEHPISGKYNPLQKLAYLVTVPLTLLMAYTGFCLWGPTMDWGFFKSGMDLVGGAMNMRIIHYFMMWAFILFTAVHVYLATLYNFNPVKIMFAWKETDGEH